MKVAILQTDIEWGSPDENTRQAEHLMAQEPDADLYVLPEMWSTGFATEPQGIAEEEATSVALAWMKSKAKELHCAICGSLAVHVDDSYRNRHYFVDGRKGVVKHYDKHHLFSYGQEDLYYTAGDSHTVVDYEGFRFLLVTCYDLRFPMWSRYSDDYPYDVIVCVANWPESRQNAWQILTRSRSIENQAYLIGCNRVGNDNYNHYRGCSAIISPIGKTLARCKPNEPDTASFLLNFESLEHNRSKFKVLEERDVR